MGYQCSSCGEWHNERPTAFRFPVPAIVEALTTEERRDRVQLGSDQCVLDGERFFMLGNVDLPVEGSAEIIRYTTWLSVSEQDFDRAADLWTTEGRESEPPYAGALGNVIPGIDGAPGVRVLVHTNPVGERPRVEIVDTEHVLRAYQTEGLAVCQADSLIHAALYGTAG